MIKPIVNTVRAFDIDCGGESATTYTGTATGKAAEGMSGFSYTINQANAKASTITATGWSGNGTCWAIRKDGSCS